MANEKRIIDANALKNSFCNRCVAEFLDDPCDPSECIFCIAVDQQPTVDAVEVVRCKDCKYYEMFTARGTMGCTNCRAIWTTTQANDFCSYGERGTE